MGRIVGLTFGKSKKNKEDEEVKEDKKPQK